MRGAPKTVNLHYDDVCHHAQLSLQTKQLLNGREMLSVGAAVLIFCCCVGCAHEEVCVTEKGQSLVLDFTIVIRLRRID